jgi:hypothetical protein
MATPIRSVTPIGDADRIHDEWQRREIGDTVLLHPLHGLKLARFERNRSYAFEGGWSFTLEPRPGDRTRLLARMRVPRGLPSLAYAMFIELPHFIMERKMLLSIKQRGEQAKPAQKETTIPGATPLTRPRIGSLSGARV